MNNQNAITAEFCESSSSAAARNPESLNSIISIPSSPPISSTNHSLIDDESVSLSLTNPLAVDWSDASQLNRHERCFSEEQQRAFDLLNRKQNDYPHQITGNYLQNGRFVVASGVKIFQRFACCGRKEGFKTVFCEKPMLCSGCARRNERILQQRFDGVFSKGTFYHVTISFTGDLPFDSISSHAVTEHWTAVNAAVRHLYDQDMINGACVIDEIAVEQFLPLRVLPHGHAIIDADVFTTEHIQEIQNFIRDHHPEVQLAVNVRSRKLSSEYEFERIIAYCNKAIDLTKHYEAEAESIVSSKARSFESLNREMRELLEGILVETYGFRKTQYCGTMHTQCKTRYIGNHISKKKPKKKRKNLLCRKAK